MIPIWNLLPTKYMSLRTRMVNEYNAYVSKARKDCDDFFNVSEIVKQPITLNSLEERIIDKNGDSYHNYMDSFRLDEDFGLKVESLIKKGFSKVVVKVILDMKEKQDGYQHIQLYNRIATKEPEKTNWNNNGMLAEKNYSLADEKVQSTYLTETIIFPIELNQLIDERMQLRYNAHGWAGDDWYKKSVRVGITIL